MFSIYLRLGSHLFPRADNFRPGEVMKLICWLFFSVLIVDWALALPNPAAVYCERLGYEYKKIPTPEGEKGVAVVAPGVQFDAWDFFKGKVGQEYSFGALCGYDTECVRTNIGTCVMEYAVCVPKGVKGRKEGTRIPLLELMEQKGVPLFDEAVSGGKKTSGDLNVPANREEDMLRIYERMGESKMLPAAFDWRTNDAHAYIGSIRDQGSCGSCYSFAAAASAEGTYNRAMGKYDINCVDFSESFIIWCLGRLPQYTNHFYGCRGADYDYAELTAITTEGICLDADFPYTETDPGSCTHWSDPVTVFGSWHRVLCGDIDAIKTAIMTYGVVDAAVNANDFNSYSGGIYSDTATNCYSSPCYYTPVNHAIALVGWDDNPPEGGGGCWILRNSWGASWGENGYMRLRYNAARVACEACYLEYLGTNTHTLSVSSAYGGANPPVGSTTNNHGASVACYVTNSPVINGTTQFVCAGWTGSGSVPATGNDTNTGSFTLTNDSTITWQWRTNFYLNITTSGSGSVDVASGWKALGSNVAATATPASSCSFAYWSGDTGGCVIVNNRITVVMDGARVITANFSSNSPAGISSGVCADYDGDEKADPAVYDETTGTWQIKLSGSGYYLLVTTFSGLGGPGYVCVSADYDGDHKADPTVYRESTGIWMIMPSSLNYTTILVLSQTLGGTGYSGVPADYDGDAKADPGAYQRERGDWKVLLSSAQYLPVEQFAMLGGIGFQAVAADYDGDRKGDPAIYGESNGYWVFKLSSIGYLEIALAQALGGAGYVPVPADYDGDAKADPAVKSETGNEWIVMFSSAGYTPTHLTIRFE